MRKSTIGIEIGTLRVAVAREKKNAYGGCVSVVDGGGIALALARVVAVDAAVAVRLRHSCAVLVVRCAGRSTTVLLVDGHWMVAKAVRWRWRSRVPWVWRGQGRLREAVSVCCLYDVKEEESVSVSVSASKT